MKVEITERHLLLEGFFSKEKIVDSLFFPSLKSVSQGVLLHFLAGFLFSFHSPLTFFRNLLPSHKKYRMFIFLAQHFVDSYFLRPNEQA